MNNAQEQFASFLKSEFNLLLNGEYNTVINDISDEIKNHEENINLSLEKGKMLFSNYVEVILYCEVNSTECSEALDYDYVTMYGILGDAYFHREMFIEAKNAFVKAITLSPSNIVLLQRLYKTLVKLEEFDELEEKLINTIKYCYTKDMLVEQYLLLITLYKHKKDYKTAVYILFLLGAALNMNDYAVKEITKIQTEINKEYDVPKFDMVLDYIKEKDILNPADLSGYYYSIYQELIKNNEVKGALDFLSCSNNIFYDKKNLKEIKRLEKLIKKQNKR